MKKTISFIIMFMICINMWACVGENQGLNSTTNKPANNVTEAQKVEMISKPPKEEYTEILLSDGRYFLCKKVQSGFSENSEQYGIYDGKKKVWSLKYAEYEADGSLEFYSHGDGVFSYRKSWYYGTVVFLSAQKGGTFKTKKHVYNQDSIYFDEGKALVLMARDNGFENGLLTPDNQLWRMDVYGNMEKVTVPGIDPSTNLYWCDFLPSRNSSHELYVQQFHAYSGKESKYYIYVYFNKPFNHAPP